MQVLAKFLIFLFENLKIMANAFFSIYHDLNHQKIMNRHMNSYITKLRKNNPLHE